MVSAVKHWFCVIVSLNDHLVCRRFEVATLEQINGDEQQPVLSLSLSDPENSSLNYDIPQPLRLLHAPSSLRFFKPENQSMSDNSLEEIQCILEML